jgi:hypothetical protein
MKLKNVMGVVVAGLLGLTSTASAYNPASVVGDLVYKTSIANHAGVLYSSLTYGVSDVNTGRGDWSLYRNVELGIFNWGARRLKITPSGLSSAKQNSLKSRVDYFHSFKVRYDGNHLNQKGAWFSNGSYWEFDCVGYTERVYEDIGYNPTDNSYESGWGWPLTPAEQRNSSFLQAI